MTSIDDDDDGEIPEIKSEGVVRCAQAIHRLYELEFTGGAFHIVLDDFNISQSQIAWCWNYLHENVNAFDRSFDEHKDVFKLMLDMTDDEILSSVMLENGRWGVSWYDMAVEHLS